MASRMPRTGRGNFHSRTESNDLGSGALPLTSGLHLPLTATLLVVGVNHPCFDGAARGGWCERQPSCTFVLDALDDWENRRVVVPPDDYNFSCIRWKGQSSISRYDCLQLVWEEMRPVELEEPFRVEGDQMKV